MDTTLQIRFIHTGTGRARTAWLQKIDKDGYVIFTAKISIVASKLLIQHGMPHSS